MYSSPLLRLLAIAAFSLVVLGCNSGSDGSILIIDSDDEAGSNAFESDVPEDPASSVGGECVIRIPNHGTDDGCDDLCINHTWTCTDETVDAATTTRCDGYCSRYCDSQFPCPEGFTCRDSSAHNSLQYCMSDEPLDGEFSERSPPNMSEVPAGDSLQLRWSFAIDLGIQYQASYFDLHWGFSPDELSPHRATGTGRRTGSYNLDLASLSTGQRVYWKVVATGNGGLQTSSDVWYFDVGGPGPVETPCPDIPTVTIDGRQVDTVKIRNRCWTESSFRVGEPLGGPGGDTYFDDGQVQHGFLSNSYFYSWWEAHNEYPLDDSFEPISGQFDDSICPDGWRLPTRYEWTEAVELGNEMRLGQQSSALSYGWIGWFPPVENGVSYCPRPDGEGEVICGQFRDPVNTGTFMFLAGGIPGPDSIPIVSISRPESGSSDYNVELTNAGSPWSGYQIRCVRSI